MTSISIKTKIIPSEEGALILFKRLKTNYKNLLGVQYTYRISSFTTTYSFNGPIPSDFLSILKQLHKIHRVETTSDIIEGFYYDI